MSDDEWRTRIDGWNSADNTEDGRKNMSGYTIEPTKSSNAERVNRDNRIVPRDRGLRQSNLPSRGNKR